MTPSATMVIATSSRTSAFRCSSTPAISRQGGPLKSGEGSQPSSGNLREQTMRRTDRTRRRRHRSKWLAFLLMVLVLGGFAAAGGEVRAGSRGLSNPAKFAGAFVDWGPVGREHMLQAWEKWLKQEPSSGLCVYFYG